MSGQHQLVGASIIDLPSPLSRRRLFQAAIGTGIVAALSRRVATSAGGDLGFRPSPPMIALSVNADRHPEILADPRVRQALAHVIDLVGAAFVARGESGRPMTYMVGAIEGRILLWMSAVPATRLDMYAVNHGWASALLAEAGWSRHGGAWTVPDGEDARFELSFPTEHADVRAAASFVARNLTDFGIHCEARAVKHGDALVEANQDTFDLAMGG